MPRPDTGDAREWNPVHWFLRIPIGSRTYERNSQSFQVAVNMILHVFARRCFDVVRLQQDKVTMRWAKRMFVFSTLPRSRAKHMQTLQDALKDLQKAAELMPQDWDLFICNSYFREHGSDDRCYPHVGPWYPIRDSGSPAWPSSAPWGPNTFPEPGILRLPHSNLTLLKAQKNMFVNVFQPPNRAQGRTLSKAIAATSALLQFTIDSHEESWVCWVCDEFIFILHSTVLSTQSFCRREAVIHGETAA